MGRNFLLFRKKCNCWLFYADLPFIFLLHTSLNPIKRDYQRVILNSNYLQRSKITVCCYHSPFWLREIVNNHEAENVPREFCFVDSSRIILDSMTVFVISLFHTLNPFDSKLWKPVCWAISWLRRWNKQHPFFLEQNAEITICHSKTIHPQQIINESHQIVRE